MLGALAKERDAGTLAADQAYELARVLLRGMRRHGSDSTVPIYLYYYNSSDD